ncbi:MAG: 50S ribosomal protein L9 [Candidatus Azambacteria bacterium]|nr:50S ribosomal protein L9 [Candidatus Azambacteria bacterium]
MKIVLLKDVPSLGKRGDAKDVSDGYGHNFLIKKGLAEILTSQVTKKLETEKGRQEKLAAELTKSVTDLKEKIEKIKIVLKTKIGESGKIFGSVTPAVLLAELKKNNIKIEKNQILSKPLKTMGEHKIKIKLPQGIEAELKVVIEP